jgi:lipopolysaccharide export system permease protein
MRRLDRYILTEYLGPFLFGVGTFMVILIGVQLAPWMLRLMVRDQFPPLIVAQIFLLRLPAVIGLTFPMATVFGSLMCLANLSTQGEVVAMRAGGISFPRLSAMILGMGFFMSLMGLFFDEGLVPFTNEKAFQMITQYTLNAPHLRDLTFSIPSSGQPQRIVHAKRFDPKNQMLSGLSIIEMRDGVFWQALAAEKAQWRGQKWLLQNVQHTILLPNGAQRTESIQQVEYDVGKSPTDMTNLDQEPTEMTLAKLRRQIAMLAHYGKDNKDYLWFRQTYCMRLSVPWAAFGFALIGVPLGLRPARATTGIGLGLSLVIVFAYYVIFNACNLIGQQGFIPPVVTAWIPNVVLTTTGLALFLGSNR